MRRRRRLRVRSKCQPRAATTKLWLRKTLMKARAITRSPIVIKELIAVGDDLRKGVRSIKEIVQFNDEELTEEKIANKTKQTLRYIDKIAKLYDTALKHAARLEKTRRA